MSKRKRILLTLGGAGALICVYLWFFGMATATVLEARYVGWKIPVVKKTPERLTDLSISQVPGPRLSWFGCEFDVPWDDLDETKTRIVGRWELLYFHSGRSLLISSPLPKDFIKGMSDAGWDAEKIRRVFGDQPLQSDYEMYRVLLETTPSKVTLFTPRAQATGYSMMLVTKAIAMPPADTELFSIDTDQFRGFQYGDPKKNPRRIVVTLLDSDGGIEFSFSNANGKDRTLLTQADINRTVRSAHRPYAVRTQ
jgi:hypothetical protein